jgi:hypothetical protein
MPGRTLQHCHSATSTPTEVFSKATIIDHQRCHREHMMALLDLVTVYGLISAALVPK